MQKSGLREFLSAIHMRTIRGKSVDRFISLYRPCCTSHIRRYGQDHSRLDRVCPDVVELTYNVDDPPGIRSCMIHGIGDIPQGIAGGYGILGIVRGHGCCCIIDAGHESECSDRKPNNDDQECDESGV